MTVYKYNGDVLHHKDCTYCIFRKQIQVSKRPKREKEVCAITGAHIPEVTDGRRRYCDEYVQKGCECDACSESRHERLSEKELDKRAISW